MYDAIHVKCPRCRNLVEFQSQAGDCNRACYALADCPERMVEDIIHHEEPCLRCGALIGIESLEAPKARITNHLGMG
ncbi:MAG: hypothetical protein ACOWWM_02400 [Desulfobacterales bacterium]